MVFTRNIYCFIGGGGGGGGWDDVRNQLGRGGCLLKL